MDETALRAHVTQGKSQREIAFLMDVSQTNVRYWLGKFDIRKNKRAIYDGLGNKTCIGCGETKSINDFYKHSKVNAHSKCKICSNRDSTERLRQIKRKAVDYKGGKCQECGYDNYLGALEFHHLNPTEKDIEISKLGRSFGSAEMLAELDKCALLCSRCHREVHGGFRILGDLGGTRTHNPLIKSQVR